MHIRPEVIPFVVAAFLAGILLALILRKFLTKSWIKAGIASDVFCLVVISYLLWFFRDPERIPPNDNSAIVAGADGVIAAVTEVKEKEFLNADTIRISIFLSLFDVHVNRAPLSGKSRFLGYFPGKRFFTFQEKSSEFNQHNSILIESDDTRCLINQIVGPVCRRVVYWPARDKNVDVRIGDRIGMMKFGSRLDMYFPKADVTVVAREGDRVRAGETVVAKLRKEPGS